MPVLHGQPAEFLMTALQEYAEGARRSGIMQPLAADLGAQDIRRLAEYYAKLAPPKTQPRATGQRTDRTRAPSWQPRAIPANGIPACNACHGRDALASYPRLAGQNAAYMAGQLRLWRAGHHTSTDGAAIMAPIARRLSDGDIDAVTAYLREPRRRACRGSAAMTRRGLGGLRRPPRPCLAAAATTSPSSTRRAPKPSSSRS